jgi:hypothetical protein
MIEALDPRGDLRGAFVETLGPTRGELLIGALGAATVWAGASAASADAAAGLTHNDTRILRFDLQLEYLQATMYTQALRIGHLRPAVRGPARVIGAHEWAHAAAIKKILGPAAVPRGFFDYHGVTENESAFLKTAVAFEDLTAALLKYQAVRLDSRQVLAAAISLHSVEARHASWIRRVAGVLPTLTAFDKPQSQARMRDLIASTHFVARDPKTGATRAPGFTG